MPTLRPRKRASASSLSFVEVFARHHDRAGIGAFETREHHQQGRLAGAGRTDQTDRLTPADIEIDVLEDMNARGTLPERQIDAGQRDRRSAVKFCFCM